MRTKKSIKQDRERIALNQKHEVDYMKRIAKDQLAKLETQEGRYLLGVSSMPYLGSGSDWDNLPSKAKLKRICKGLLKCLR